MARHVLRRLLSLSPTLLMLITVAFFLMRMAPGGPFDRERAPTSAEVEQALRSRYHLDASLAEQYLRYLGNMLRGDFGVSFTQQNREVNDIIREPFPVSLLGVLAIGFAALGGVFWGFFRTPESQRDWPAIHKALARCEQHFAKLEQLLDANPFLLGETLSLADITAGTSLNRYFGLEIARPSLPAVGRSQSAEGDKNGLWTTVIAAAILLP